ncbi:MAG TPA: radical SAM protein [bacterium]|nr:radical SAM protein [bacterium]
MTWKLKKSLERRLASEQGAVIKEPGGKTAVALVYPNTYAVGMGNLAIHSLYRMMNSRSGMLCERFFLPDRADMAEHRRTKTPPLSVESGKPLGEFSAAAFSISFENDLLNVLPLFEIASIPHAAEMRGKDFPLMIAGGAVPTLNPRPVSAIFDAIAIGEAECFAEELFDAIGTEATKEEKLERISKIPGIWVPSLGDPPERIARRWLEDLDPWPTHTAVHSRDAEFAGMHLIEVQRGCPFSCRFCATPEIYRPPRRRSFEAVMAMVKEGLEFRKKFGLVGASILSHPQFTEIARAIHSSKATFSPSSVRVGDIDEEKAELLAASGHRSVALGIESGSERLRYAIGKGLSDDGIFGAIEILAKSKITNLRLYFMIGLPGETEEDVKDIASLSLRIATHVREHAPKTARQTSLSITLSPFVPKPGTPFAEEPFAGEAKIKMMINGIRGVLQKHRGISVNADSPLSAAIESFLSNAGAREALSFLERTHRGENIRRILAC